VRTLRGILGRHGAPTGSQWERHDPGFRKQADGLIYHDFAADPAGAAGRHARVRTARILYPLLARVAVLGRADLVGWSLLLVNLAAIVLGTEILHRLLERRGITPWAALGYGGWCGLGLALLHDTAEPVAYLCGLAGVAAQDRGRPALAGAAFLGALLTRETALLFVGPFLLLGWRGAPGPSRWLGPLGVLGGWGAWLGVVLVLGTGSTGPWAAMRRPPLVNFLTTRLADLPGTVVFLLVPALLVLGWSVRALRHRPAGCETPARLTTCRRAAAAAAAPALLSSSTSPSSAAAPPIRPSTWPRAARILKLGSIGARPDRWFSQVDAAAPGLHPRYRWSARLVRWAGALGRRPLPRPQHVSVGNPLPIVRWMRELLDRGRTPHLVTLASSAVRLCEAARAAGLDLDGAQFLLIGEPVTAARLDAIRGVGAEGRPRYGTIECGPLGYGCLAPAAPDDVHIVRDLAAIVQPGESAARPDVPARALLVTSLHPAAPFVLLNVAMGDVASPGERAAAGPLAGPWPAHLDSIRSYEKLTAGGMNLLDTDVIHVLERVLPARFGGGGDGRPARRARGPRRPPEPGPAGAHPRVGPLDEEDVARVFFDAVGAGAGAERVMGLAWREAGVLWLERREPLMTGSGKILHLHAAGGPGTAPP
jgi:hypothetical protein